MTGTANMVPSGSSSTPATSLPPLIPTGTSGRSQIVVALVRANGGSRAVGRAVRTGALDDPTVFRDKVLGRDHIAGGRGNGDGPG